MNMYIHICIIYACNELYSVSNCIDYARSAFINPPNPYPTLVRDMHEGTHRKMYMKLKAASFEFNVFSIHLSNLSANLRQEVRQCKPVNSKKTGTITRPPCLKPN